MQFFVALALFGTAAVAAETVQIKDAIFTAGREAPQTATFTIQPDNVKCSSTSADELATGVACGESSFTFQLGNGGNGEYNLTLHKQNATTGAAISGSKDFLVGGEKAADGQSAQVHPSGDLEITLN